MHNSSPARIFLEALTTIVIRPPPPLDLSTEKYFLQFGVQSWLIRAANS